MHSTPVSIEVFQWVRRTAISAALLVFITGTASAQYQSVNWDEPVGGGSGSTGSPPEQDQKEEEEERNVAAQISITIDQPSIPVPARGEPAASVSVTVRALGTKGSLAGARVRFDVVGPASSFVSTPGGFSMEQPALNGSWR